MKKFFIAIVALFIGVAAFGQMRNRTILDVIEFKVEGIRLYTFNGYHKTKWFVENRVAMGGDFYSQERFNTKEEAQSIADAINAKRTEYENKYSVVIGFAKVGSYGGKYYVNVEAYDKKTCELQDERICEEMEMNLKAWMAFIEG